MFRKLYRRYRTTIPEVPGTWQRNSPTEIVDSSLGIIRSEAMDPRLLYIDVGDFKDLYVSLRVEDLATSMPHVRSLLVNFPQQDYWYRRFIAEDLYEIHQLLSREPIPSKSDLAEALKISWFQILYPSVTNVWYNAGNLFGDGRPCAWLDSRRRFGGGAIG